METIGYGTQLFLDNVWDIVLALGIVAIIIFAYLISWFPGKKVPA
jgi:hypothetical protein